MGSPALAAADPPETTTVRLVRVPAICQAPQYVAEDLLRSDGFTDIRYVDTPTDAIAPAVGRGEADFGTLLGAEGWERMDAGGVVAWTDDYSDIIGAMLRKKLGR